ncbi:hypothetical protein AUK10_04185 [Candidatus Gracilibacteria bacterium CG2_30_37_12]|nr:MAG: hypothetical protein AUK10_04185 [Candidatus Gracilibacteria bacterium CG2_30_37_12]
MRLFITRFFFFVFVSFFLLDCIAQVDARAGGGRSFRSSSSSSSFGSSSSFSFGSPSFGSSGTRYVSTGSTGNSSSGVIIFIFIMIVIFVIVSGYGRRDSLFDSPLSGDNYYVPPNSSNHKANPSVAPVTNLSEKITAIKAIDPAFNEGMLEDRVSTAFFKIQNAWCKGDMNLARAFVTDSVLRRFNMQLEEYRQSKTYNKLEGLTLDDVTTLDISLDANIERIDIHIIATAKDYVVDEAGKYVSGDNKQFVTWDEKWGFVRNAGVKTDAEKSVFSEKCPNCGAPLKVDTTGECEYCRSNITTGKFDWVLSEITQLNT